MTRSRPEAPATGIPGLDPVLRLPLLLSALTHPLNARCLASVIAVRRRGVVGGELEVPSRSFPTTAENLILLGDVEPRSRLRRLVSVLKVRDAGHDTSLREFVIGPRGFAVAETFEGGKAVLSGVARVVASDDGEAASTGSSLPAKGNRRP